MQCMEGGGGVGVGGERKRKLDLDFDKLLGSKKDDDEEQPLPTVVVTKKVAAMGGGGNEEEDEEKPAMGGGGGGNKEEDEEKPTRDPYLAQLPIMELQQKIARAYSMIRTRTLPDGGDKMIANLRKLEFELEWRKNPPKDDDKCKKVYLVTDESMRTAVGNGSSHGAPTSASAQQSSFALHFGSKLDNEKGHGNNRSFREELSTLHRCDSKNINTPEQIPTQRTLKLGSSSRDVPFKSAGHLSADTYDHPQSNFKQLGSHFYTPSPRHTEADGCFAKNENAARVQPSRKCTRNNRNIVLLVDEEEFAVDAADPTDQLDQCAKATSIFYPSSGDPESIEIRYKDMLCLAPETFVSSTIMNFYIRYLQKPASPSNRKGNYQFFTTYFYQKLKQFVNKIDKEISFPKFRRWWKGVNIFEKAYIFLPIHENFHWSLVIICIPDKEEELGPVILHLDSLGVHNSRQIFSDVRSFLKEEWTFLKQEEVLPEFPIPDRIWKRLSRKIDDKVIEVPQQENEYDCGLFVLFFIERFIGEAPERLKKKDLEMFGRQWFRPEEASSLRQKIKSLLIGEFKKANADISKSDV